MSEQIQMSSQTHLQSRVLVAFQIGGSPRLENGPENGPLTYIGDRMYALRTLSHTYITYTWVHY